MDEKLRIALRLAGIISKLDKLVFGENKIEKKIVIIRKKPEENETFVWYMPKEKNPERKDYYKILGYADKIVAEGLKNSRHISVAEQKSGKSYGELQSLTEDELLIGIAAHEIRHGLQYYDLVDLFSPEDAEYIKDPELRLLINFVNKSFELNPPITAPREKEFDARIIEHLASKKWHEKESFEEIAKIIKINPKKLRETTPVLFYPNSFIL